MFKIKFIFTVLKALLWMTVIGVGVLYMSRSIGGDAMVYMSLDSFLRAVGACDQYGVCDLTSANGCFLCPFIEELFYLIGTAAYMFWDALIGNIWILLSLGFAIYLFQHTYSRIKQYNEAAAKLTDNEKKLNFSEWFNDVWKQAVRVLIVGALLGAIGFGGAATVRLVADITITPVMYIGTSIAIAASGMDPALCGTGTFAYDAILGPALQPFLCVVGYLNTVVLAGAAGGFSLMNYAWAGLGGGLWTWIAGLTIVIIFLFIGFNLFFKILSVIFQLVFLIIFLPLIIAAWAYQNKWKLLDGAFTNALTMLARCAMRIIAITLQILIFYAMVSFAAQQYFPTMLPAGILDSHIEHTDARTVSVIGVFQRCEIAGTLNHTQPMDRQLFRECFNFERIAVERAHPGAFDFLRNGFDFILMMLLLSFVWHYAIKKKVDELFSETKIGNDDIFSSDTNVKDQGTGYEYGKHIREFTAQVWRGPAAMIGRIEKQFTKKDK
ncbi:MAG: hypothetical protein FWC83_00460 [Alphaproteobacteria bacterium]|nr:hypothetical protein [Alphaproteobacteria bacterium]